MLSEDQDGEVDFEAWQFKIDLTLKSKKIYEYVTGAKPKPAGKNDEKDVIEWVEKDIEAQTVIGINVSKAISKKILSCTTALEMYEKLQNLYGKKSDYEIEGLQRKFFSYTFDSSKSAVANCNDILQLAEDLTSLDGNNYEQWAMTRMLSILPPHLYHFRTSWDNVVGNQRTIPNLMEKLRLEEDRIKAQEGSNESTSNNALVMQQRKKTKQHNNHKPDKPSGGAAITCFKCGLKGHMKKQCRGKPCAKYLAYCKENYPCHVCGQKGHFARDCLKRNDDRSDNERSDKGDRRYGGRSGKLYVAIGLSSAEVKNQKRGTNENWYQDSGATQHMTSHKRWFVKMRELEQPITVSMGDSRQLKATSVGDIELEVYNGVEWKLSTLEDVLYVPGLNFNLLSLSQIMDRGHTEECNKDVSVIKAKESQAILSMAQRDGNLYKVMFRQPTQNTSLIATSIVTWHERLAHQNLKYVRDILNRNNIKFIDDWGNRVCDGCVLGKQQRVSHPENVKVADQPLDLVHVDLGEMNERSIGGAKYFLMFKDDYSHFRTVYYLKSKDQAADKLRIYLKEVENQFGRNVKVLRSDHGKEIDNSTTRKILEELGVRHTFSNVHTPEQNGRIEREMRTIVESARSAMHARNLKDILWAEAVNYAVFTINQTGTSTVAGKSPADLWYGRRIDINKLRIFGCDCWVLNTSQTRKKLDRKSRKGIFVGYDLQSSSYRVYIPGEREVICSENVTFSEGGYQSGGKPVKSANTQSSEADQNSGQVTEQVNEETDETETTQEPAEMNFEGEITEDEETPREEDENAQDQRRAGLRDRSKILKPGRLKDFVLDFYNRNANVAMIGEVEDIPVSEALKDEGWKRAMQEEFDSLMQMKTWRLVKCPEGVKPLTCRWVLRERADGRLKARLVARGFEQEEGINYTETFSPVARHASIRLMLSYAATEKMKLVAFDVKTAFLHGKLEEVIYMRQPEGFDDGTNHVCELEKSLYGLKQAPRNWHDTVSTFFEKEIGLVSSDDDPCLFYNQDKSIMMTLFVDDGLIAGRDEAEIYRMLDIINKKFEITFNKKAQEKFAYLGMEIQVGKEGIFVGQAKYTNKIIKRFKSDSCNPSPTPMEKGMMTDEGDKQNDQPVAPIIPYREAIGSLLYLATISRPDICFAVNYLSRFNGKAKMSHWKMVRRIFQYLKGTPNLGIFFDGGDELVAYSDSDYGGDPETKHSTTGVLVMRGGPIVWYTQKQRLVATSTAEAEYRAAVAAIDEVCWVKRIGLELEILKKDEPVKLLIDNQAAIQMMLNAHEGKTTKGKKHIEIPRRFIQEHVNKTVALEHVESANQLADMFTKPLPRKLFESQRCKIIKEECCD